MAHVDTSLAIADSITEQYAGVMDDLIKECTNLEDKILDLRHQLAVALQVRDAAIAARDQARRERGLLPGARRVHLGLRGGA